MMRRTVDMTVEFTEFDRPRLLGSKSRSVTRGGPGRPMVTVGRLMFERVSDGTRMHWAWEWRHQARCACSSRSSWMGRRQERRIWGSLKRLLEGQ